MRKTGHGPINRSRSFERPRAMRHARGATGLERQAFARMLAVMAGVAVVALFGIVVSATSSARARGNASDTVLPGGPPCPAATYGSATPVVTSDVPAAIPCSGVRVADDAVILPPGAAGPAVSGATALVIARQIVNAHPYLATALLGSVTDPGSIPPAGTRVPFRTIRDRLAWVVTFTAPTPMNVTVGGHFPKSAKPANPVLVSRMNLVIDAHTGGVLYAFFTV